MNKSSLHTCLFWSSPLLGSSEYIIRAVFFSKFQDYIFKNLFEFNVLNLPRLPFLIHRSFNHRLSLALPTAQWGKIEFKSFLNFCPTKGIPHIMNFR